MLLLQPGSLSFVHHSTGVSASWRMTIAIAILTAYLRVSSVVTNWNRYISHLARQHVALIPEFSLVTNKNIDLSYISDDPIAIFLWRLTYSSSANRAKIFLESWRWRPGDRTDRHNYPPALYIHSQ